MTEYMTRRQFLKTTAAGVATMALSGTTRRAYAEKSETLRIGYLPITDATPLLIAHANGYFQEEGLNVARPIRVRSWSTLCESFLTDKFNLTHLLIPIPVWMRYNKQAAVKILAWDHTNGSALTVRSDAGIKGFADLGGKQIAVPYWYSMHNIILQYGLERVGLTPVIQPQSVPLKPNEVNLFVVPPPEMPVSLAGRKIDGYIVAEPFNAVGEIRAGAKILRFTGDIWKNHPCCVVVMKEALIRSKPVFTQKVINAIVRAQLWITHHLEETARILSREGEKYLPIPRDILQRAIGKYDSATYGKGAVPQAIKHPDWQIQRIGFQPYPYPSATRFILERLRQTKVEGNTEFLTKLETDFAVRDLVDDTFVKNAIQSVGGPDKFETIDVKTPWQREEIVEL